MKQFHTQRLLETTHNLSYSGRRHAQLVSGNDVAEVSGRSLQGAQGVQVVRCLHDGLAYSRSGVISMQPGS